MLIGYRGGEQITDHIVPHIIYHSGSPKALARLRTKGVETLMQLTNHDDEKIREVSISLLGELGAADSVELLAGALYDQKQQVRMRAIRALGKVASSKVAVSRALSILTQAVEKEKENRYSFGLNETLQELVLTIASLNNVESRNTVEKLAQDPNVDVRCAAAHALGQSHWPNSSHILLELLEDNDEQARGAAATALGKLGDPSNLKQLILVYLDPGQPPGVRDKARDAIWNVDSPTVVEFFVEHMNDLVDRDHARENDPEEAAQLAFTSLLSTSTDHLGSILEQLVHGSEWAQRRVAGLLLKSAGEKRGFGYPTELRITRWVKGHAITVCDLLQPLLGHPDEEVRLAAAITLAKAGCEDAFESIAAGLAKFLEREEWPEVVACAAALGRLGDERAINILERTRQCDDGWASLAASVSLGFLGVDQDNALQEWTSLSFSMGEKDMLPLIAELGGEKAIPKLAQALDLGALQEDVYPLMLSVGYTEVFDEVVGLLAREEWNVREKAVLALGTAGDLRGANYLKILLSDPQPAVRQAAQEAFGTLTRPYQPDLAFSLNADNQLRTGDWTPAHLHLHNGGQGEASNITLDWPEEFAEMRYIGETSVVKLLPDESADLALTVRPQSAGSAVPLEVSLHYADAFGFEHKLQRATTIQVVREWLGPQTQQTLVVHGSYYKDSVQVTGDVGLIRSVGPTRSQPETTPLQCANCGEKLVEGWKVCPKCGVPVKRRCPSCGHNLETDWLFCPACATRVSDELEED
jgi:HEAT repeat protein